MTTPAPQDRSGSGVRARLTRFSPSLFPAGFHTARFPTGRGGRSAGRSGEQLSIPGMEEVLNPKIDDGRPQDTERSLWIDITVVVALTVLTVVPYVTSVILHPSVEYVAALVSSMMMVASVSIRRDQPIMMLALVSVGAGIQLLLVPWPVLSILTIPIASYSVARWVDGAQSRWVLWVGALGAILGPARWHAAMTADYPSDGGTPWMLLFLSMTVCAGLVITPYAVGRRLREAALIESQQRMAKAERYRAILAEREQDAHVIEERTRNEIARELHDIVAHSLSVMIVQAEGGKALAAKKPEKAADVLDIIADTGRDALVEMRRIVGVLRKDPSEKAAYSPSPGLTDIPELVEHSGERITLTVTGQRPEVSEALGLTAYRVVQEAVTNVLKHAGPTAHAEVAVHYRQTTMSLTITDDGHGETIQGDGRGHGLQGMRERVTSMGGQLETGPLADHGFRVHALLPLGACR